MARVITGIEFACGHLEEMMASKTYYDRLDQEVITVSHETDAKGILLTRHPDQESMVKRVKIVHIDLAWDIEHEIMPRDVLFGSPESQQINTRRVQNPAAGTDPLHGTTCVAAMKMNNDPSSNSNWPLTEDESKLWNLADFAEVLLVPTRDAIDENDLVMQKRALSEFMGMWEPDSALGAGLSDAIDPSTPANTALKETAERLLPDLMPIYNQSVQIGGALTEVLELKKSGVLNSGDLVVVTVHTDLDDNGQHLPIIHNPWVELEVEKLTSEGISVIIPAGNSGSDLGGRYFPRFGGATMHSMEQQDRELFRNHGVRCGAILVGAQKGNRNDKLINHGSCVDVFGRSNISIPETKGLPIDDEMYGHWGGSTIASIVAASILACVQQIRLASDRELAPLKPYEARAHFRQWRSFSSDKYDCFVDLIGPPPDVRDWLVGTRTVDL